MLVGATRLVERAVCVTRGAAPKVAVRIGVVCRPSASLLGEGLCAYTTVQGNIYNSYFREHGNC